jgi:Tfp pilus assembly protein PilF
MQRMKLAILSGLAVLQYACATATLPLSAPAGSNATAAQHNSEGITHYEMSHWSVARDHFASAVQADPNLAESHFNLALALDKLDLHSEAKTHFKQAGDLAPGNRAITESTAYRSHTRSSSSIYGPSSYGGMGGY